MKTIQERARNYIAPIQSISGSGGHAAAYTAAVALVRGYDLPDEIALSILTEWNQSNATPPWSESDMRHKISQAAKSDRPAGYLLVSKSSNPWHPGTPTGEGAGKFPFSGASKAFKRQQWPRFRLGTDDEIRIVADLRKIHPGIPWLAQKYGFLRFTASSSGDACFVLAEGALAQVRRMDGLPFTKADGTTIKSRNLPGSEGKWLGISLLERHRHAPALIVEGLIAWMEAAEAITRLVFPKPVARGTHRQWVPLAALSASVKLEARELALLSGRKVIIARDRGSAGADAAVSWRASLAEIGVAAHIWTPPPGAKDLGEALNLPHFDVHSIFNLS